MMKIGDHVKVLDLDHVSGRIYNVRPDPAATESEIEKFGGFIYTVELDSSDITPDGLYVAREFELEKLEEMP